VICLRDKIRASIIVLMREELMVFVAFSSQIGYFFVCSTACVMFHSKLFCCGHYHGELH
jgi:hypothetical protein